MNKAIIILMLPILLPLFIVTGCSKDPKETAWEKCRIAVLERLVREKMEKGPDTPQLPDFPSYLDQYVDKIGNKYLVSSFVHIYTHEDIENSGAINRRSFTCVLSESLIVQDVSLY